MWQSTIFAEQRFTISSGWESGPGMMELGRGAVYCSCNALIMARSDCRAAHSARRSWLGTEQWAHLIMPFCLASSNVRRDDTTCSLCVHCGVKLKPHIFAAPCQARGARRAPVGTPSVYHPTPRGPLTYIPKPVGPPLTLQVCHSPACCSALVRAHKLGYD